MSIHHVFTLFFTCIFILSSPALAQEIPSANPEASKARPEAYDLKNVPDEYIEEALNFYDHCEATPKLNQHHDCQCLSAVYLDKRIEYGPDVGQTSIIMDIEEKCPDATNAAGMRYQECLNNQMLTSKTMPIEEYCTCYANEYARTYERYAPEPNSQTFIAIETQAMITCQNPELGRRLYR